MGVTCSLENHTSSVYAPSHVLYDSPLPTSIIIRQPRPSPRAGVFVRPLSYLLVRNEARRFRVDRMKRSTGVQSQSAVTTFLFTDIEGSTRLWEKRGERMRETLACHDSIARAAVTGHNGSVVKMSGDGFPTTQRKPNAPSSS